MISRSDSVKAQIGGSSAQQKTVRAQRKRISSSSKRKIVPLFFPEIHIVGGQKVGDKIETLLEPIEVSTKRYDILEHSVNDIENKVLAIIAIAPIQGFSIITAAKELSQNARTKDLPLICVISKQPDTKLERELYRSGATAVFEWPKERANLVPYLQGLLHVGVKKSSPSTNDRAIRKNILAQLAPERSGVGKTLDVTVTDGVVNLSGKVESLWQLKIAQQISASVPGVKFVLSFGADVSGKRTSDKKLVEAVRGVIRLSSKLDLKTLEISARKGVVTLKGAVTDAAELSRIEDLISNLHGVREIKTLVVVSLKQKRRDTKVANEINQRIKSNFPKEKISTSVFGGVVVIKGKVSRLSVATAIGKFVLRHDGVSRLVNKLTISARRT
jgi:osmotically-inducible protein OsmY